MTPEELADAFAAWASAEGLLPRITEEQCRDLASAFAAGALYERSTAPPLKRRLAMISEGVDNFLAAYGSSEIPMFKVGQDLANSIRKRLDGKLDDL